MATSTPKTTAPAVAEHPNLASALAEFQKTLPSVVKGNTANVVSKSGAKFSYDYADLTDVSAAVLPALAAVGLAWTCGIDTMDDSANVMLSWSLMHGASGESLSGQVPVGRVGTPWQELGSALTYARRYCLIAATGVAPGGDDDDATAAGTPSAPASRDNSPRRASTPAPVPPARPVDAQPEFLPADLYDLGGIATVEDARALYRQAGRAGHLHLLVQNGEGGETIALGGYLTLLGQSLEDPDEASERAAVLAYEETLDGAQS